MEGDRSHPPRGRQSQEGHQQLPIEPDATSSLATGGVTRPQGRSTLMGTLILLMAVVTTSMLGLVAASDAILGAFPREQCLPLLASYWTALKTFAYNNGKNGSTGISSDSGADLTSSDVCWAGRVYGLSLRFDDLTPNIGGWWYFFAQVFPQQRTFFSFVAHALCALFAVPAALRFPRRGLLLAVLQLGATTMLRPYASLGDLGLYLTTLLFLQPQLQRFGTGLMLCNSLMLLLVLGPAMWTQWIDVESANPNFFYSITLLLGAWHTFLMVQIVLSTGNLEVIQLKRRQ